MIITFYNANLRYNNSRYYFLNLSTFKNALSVHSIIKSYSVDNYRINTEVLRVNLTASSETTGLTLSEAESVRSILMEDTNYYRFYYINSYVIQSGYILFYLSIDYWHSYIAKVNIENGIIRRCNKNIGTGVYDPIEQTKGNPTYSYLNVNGAIDTGTGGQHYYNMFDTSKLYLVLALNFVVYTSGNSDASVTRVETYAISLKDFKKALYDSATGASNKTSIARSFYYPLINKYISGIYACNYSSSGNDFEGNVINAYIIDADLLDVVNDTGIYTKSKMYTNGVTDFTLSLHSVRPSVKNKNIFTFGNLSPIYEHYIGTKGNGLKVSRNTNTYSNIDIQAIVTTSNVKVIVRQGNNEKEITEGFRLSFTTTSGNLTAQREQVDIFRNILNFISSGAGIVTGIVTQNPLTLFGGLMGTAKNVSNLLDDATAQSFGNVVQGGDASTTFKADYSYTGTTDTEALNYPVANPYVEAVYLSIIDENKRVSIFGASFQVELGNMGLSPFLNNTNYLGGYTTAYTYIVLTGEYKNAPQEAIEEISSTFRNGVYLYQPSNLE